MIAQRVGERVGNDLKRPALVAAFEVLHILPLKREAEPADATEKVNEA